MFRCISVAILLVGSLAVSNGLADEPILFKRFPLKNSVSCQALTEDGQFLIVGHQAEDLISVIDTSTLKVVKEVECRQPVEMLCRGDKILVANYGEDGTISVFSRKENWDQVDEVEVGKPNPELLSAPGGDSFHGVVIVKCHGDARYNMPIMAVDVNKDRFAEIANGRYSAGAVDFDGRYFFMQGGRGSPSRAAESVLDYRALLQGRKVELAGRSWDSLPILYQVRKGPFWFGGNHIYRGMPPKAVGEEYGQLLIPDRMANACYAIDETSITCHALDGALSKLGRINTAWPEQFTRNTNARRAWPVVSTDRNEFSHRHLAATIGDRFLCFIWAANESSFYYISTRAFDGARYASSNSAAGGSTAPGESPSDGTFPTAVPVGKTVEFRLVPKDTKGEFILVDAPKGVRVASDGLLTWKPTSTQKGTQRIKVRAIVDGKSKFLRFSTVVIDRSAAVASRSESSSPPSGSSRPTSKPQPTNPPSTSPGSSGRAGAPGLMEPQEELGVHALNTDVCFLAYTADGKSIMLLDGESVRVLDATGISVKGTVNLNKNYRAVYERPNYLVGLAAVDVDLIDKRTGKVLKSIEVGYSKVEQLAIHPNQPVSFVSVLNPSEKTDFAKRNPVLQIDEKTGEVRELPGVHGMWVATDPQGKYLFASSKETYKSGSVIDFRSPGGVRDTFSSRDVVVSYDISATPPKRASSNAEPGANGQKLVVAPDGKHVSYVAGGGAPGYGYSIAALAPNDLSREVARYQVEAYPKAIAYHPAANLVACTNGRKIWIFDRRTGERQDGRLDLSEDLKDVREILFAPDGSRLLVAHQHPRRGRVVQSFALKLSESEQVAVAASARDVKTGSTAAQSYAPRGVRVWSDKSGRFTLEAELIEVKGNTVFLRRTDGKKLDVPINALSKQDREYLKSLNK